MSASLLKHALQSHPANPAPPGLRVAVQRLAPDDPLRPLRLRFELLRRPGAVRLPGAVAVRRAAGAPTGCGSTPVSRRSSRRRPASDCAGPPVEAGSGPAPAPYVEFNLAPSGAWAAYRFDGYRAGMRPEPLTVEPRVIARLAAGQLSLEVALAWPTPLPGAVAPPSCGCRATRRPRPRPTPQARRWQGRLGLTAVIEAADGNLSYWALHHPAARADFHNVEGFALGIEVPQ